MIGIGTDLVELSRFRRVVDRTPGIVGRAFTVEERSYADRRRDPVERYAVRWAAKEAVMKALGVGIFDVPMRDIEVLRAESGEPSVLLHRKAAAIADERGVRTWRLTLTHTESLAQAIAVAL
jgi:holo-[acyl-carrier protein] synthase